MPTIKLTEYEYEERFVRPRIPHIVQGNNPVLVLIDPNYHISLFDLRTLEKKIWKEKSDPWKFRENGRENKEWEVADSMENRAIDALANFIKENQK